MGEGAEKPRDPKLQEGDNISKVPPYRSADFFAQRFSELIKAPHRHGKPERYSGHEGGLLFLRYYNVHRRRRETDEGRGRYKSGPINPQNVDTATFGVLPEGVKIPDQLTYRNVVGVRRAIAQEGIDDSYNTEDGPIRWLVDHGFGELRITGFIQIVPPRVRDKMRKWRGTSSGLTASKATEIRSKILNIDVRQYNSFDGKVRWLRDNGFQGTNLMHFWQIIPRNVRRAMTLWTFDRYHVSFKDAEKRVTEMQSIWNRLDKEYQIDDPSVQRRVLNFLASTNSDEKEVAEILETACKYSDRLISELSTARLITPEQRELDIQDMHDLYRFAKERLGLESKTTWVILRLRRMNLRGVRTLIREGERSRSGDISLNTPLGDDRGSPTLEDRIGYLDPGFLQVEARLVLEQIAKSGHLNETQAQVLEKVIGGQDIEDEEYETLASAIRIHPELMELLGIEDEE